MIRTHVISKREELNNLPDEILSYIFNIYAAKLPGWLKTVADKTRTRASPLLVAQICYRWRQVAIATPSLWTFLTFSDKKICEFPIERLWLERSKACLVDVQIDEDFETKQFIDGVFDILLPHFHRVRAFSILFFDYPPVPRFLNRFPKFAPVLGEFRLVYRRDGHGFSSSFSVGHQIPLLRAGAPQLKHVTFIVLFADWDTFPFANLESLYLTMTTCTWEQFANFSKAIPRLRTFKIHLSGPDHPDHKPETWPQEIISFPATTFHFGSENANVLRETLKRVVFPNIEDVALLCGIVADTSRILDMLCQRRPFVTADRLHIEGFSCPDGSLTDKMLLSSFGFPNITRLFLRRCSTILSALVEGRYPCFPRLKRLVTYFSEGENIRSIVEARKEHKISPLSFVRVRRAKPTTKKELDWLEKNIKDVKIRLMVDEEYDNYYDDCISGEEDHGYGEKVEGAHPSYPEEDYSEEGGIGEGGIEEEVIEEDAIEGHGTELSDSEEVIDRWYRFSRDTHDTSEEDGDDYVRNDGDITM